MGTSQVLHVPPATSRSPRLWHGAGQVQSCCTWVQSCCQADGQGCLPLEPAQWSWLPGRVLKPGLGRMPCSLPAPGLLQLVG